MPQNISFMSLTVSHIIFVDCFYKVCSYTFKSDGTWTVCGCVFVVWNFKSSATVMATWTIPFPSRISTAQQISFYKEFNAVIKILTSTKNNFVLLQIVIKFSHIQHNMELVISNYLLHSHQFYGMLPKSYLRSVYIEPWLV